MPLNNISKLEKRRPQNFIIGLIVSLALVNLAFEYSVDSVRELPVAPAETNEEIPIRVQRTVQKEARVSPPLRHETVNILDDIPEIEFTEVPEKLVLNTLINEPLEIPEPTNDFILQHEPHKPPKTPLAEDPHEESDDFILIAEVMPSFGDCGSVGDQMTERQCSDHAIIKYLVKHLKYPTLASANGIEGMVVLSFIVEKDGSLTDIEILKDPGGGLGREAIRVVSQMPNWKPGKQRGRAVRVQFRLPVRFALK